MIFESTDSYIATDELSMAVDAAAKLERPLLIKGEPGTGKTMLAIEVAKSLGMPLLEWHIKSTTKAVNGLYEYDAVSRLRDSQLGDERVNDISNYIKKGKLWEAFEAEERVVLLIDEIEALSVLIFGILDSNTRRACSRQPYARRSLGGSLRPFGGLNLILCGDWWQLTPVLARSFCSNPFKGSMEHAEKKAMCMFWRKDKDSLNALSELTEGKGSAWFRAVDRTVWFSLEYSLAKLHDKLKFFFPL